MMKVYIKGTQKQEINLTDRNFITSGGEGKIYGKYGVIYKIYLDKNKAISSFKVNDLKNLNKDNILYPKDILLNNNQIPIGITMNWITNTVPICKLFTNDFRSRSNIKPNVILKLVNNMASTIQFIHSKKCLIVDGSEMNYLVDEKTFETPYFIDVDSYQTPNFPATAITPSIKDYHCKKFSELSDWFSFAIISFQLFVGIHPFKGSHPDYKRNELEKRMIDNVSVFNSKVKLPNSVRDFSHIPDNYKNWYKELFDSGKRILPPSIVGKILVTTIPIIIQSTEKFDLTLIRTLKENIVKYYNGVLFTETIAYYNKYETPITKNTDIVSTRFSNLPVYVNIENNKLKLQELNGNRIDCNIDATDKTIINDKLYVLNNGKLFEIQIEEMNKKFITLVTSTWDVLPQATKLFDGVVYQEVLGVPYLMLPYPHDSGKTFCYIHDIPELKGCKILEAKHDSRVIILVGYKQNKYYRFILKFNSGYSEYKCFVTEDVTYHVPNFVTLENGIVVSINWNDEVEIFNRHPGNKNFKVIQDKMVNFSMKLCKKGTDVFIRKDNKLFNFSMKK